MISSIFGKTKPINFIILTSFLLCFYGAVHFFVFKTNFTLPKALLELGVFLVVLFSLFVLDFIVKRNKLTAPSSYAMLFFTLLFLLFPEAIADYNAILCSFFLLLATRRILSLKTLKETRIKVFDAALWILTASLFYDWALLYFLLLLVSLYIYEPKVIKNWVVLFAAGFSFFMISYAVLLLLNKQDFFTEHYKFSVDFSAIYEAKWESSLRISGYVLLNIALMAWSSIALAASGTGRVITLRLVALSFIIGLGVNILVFKEGTYAIMITFFPSVIFICSYIDAIKRQNLVELTLLVSIAVPLLIFLGTLWLV